MAALPLPDPNDLDMVEHYNRLVNQTLPPEVDRKIVGKVLPLRLVEDVPPAMPAEEGGLRRLAFLSRLKEWLWNWRVSLARIDQNAKCPGCGHREGRIEFSCGQKVMVHHCMICRARWGEPTIMKADEWAS